MDDWTDRAKLRIGLVVVVVVLTSAYLSCVEVKYAIWGKTADAEITRTFEFTEYHRHGLSEEKLAVQYHFREQDGTDRKEVMNRSANWQVPADNRLRIQYLPGEGGAARPAGERSYVALGIFLVSLSVLGFFTVKTWREAYK